MKKQWLFIGAVFALFFVVFVLQKPFFLIFSPELKETLFQKEWQVFGSMFAMDLILSGLLTIIPALLVFLMRMAPNACRVALNFYFVLSALLIAGLFTGMSAGGCTIARQLITVVAYATLILAVIWKYLFPRIPQQ